MLEEKASIQAINILQQGITTANTLARLQELTQVFGQTYLAADVVDLACTAVPPSDHSHTLEFSINQTDCFLFLQRTTPFNDNEKMLAQMMAALLATAPYFLTREQPSPYQLTLLSRISQAVANEQQFKAITAVLEKGFSEALPQASAKLLLWKRQTNELVVQSLLGQPRATNSLMPVVIEGFMAQVIESGETAVLSTQSPPQLIVPATVKGEVVALLHVFYPEKANISPGDITFLKLLVGYVGIAFNNTRLLGQAWQRANQLETIYRITDSVIALQPLEPTLTAIQERLMSAFNASICYVALYDSATQTLSFPWFYRYKERINQQPVSLLDDNSLVAWVVANNQPFITGDTWTDQLPVEGAGLGHDTTPRSIICVPLRDGNEVVGAISIQNDSPNAFDTAEFKTFMAVSAHIAIIIKNAHLYDQTQNLVNQGTRDYQTAVALRQAIAVISTSLAPNEIFEQLLLAMSDVFAYDTAFACLLGDGKLRCVASHDFHDRPLPISGLDLENAWQNSSLLNEMGQSQETIIISDVADDSRWVAVPGNEAVKSWMGAPLVVERKVLGVLLVHSYRVDNFGEHEKWLLTTLCANTAVALKNAQLYQRTQQQLSEISTLYQASATMTANLDQDFVLQTVVAEMVRALKVDSCTIFVWNENKQSFTQAAHKSVLYSDENKQAVGLKTIEHLAKYPPVQKLFKTQQIYSLRHDKGGTSDDELALLEAAGMQSILFVPLVRRKQMLGLLALGQFAQPRIFRQSELWLAQNLAGQAAVAIEHAHLFSQAQRRIDELSTFHSIVLQLNTPLQLSSVLDTITESALRLVDASNLHIYLYDDKTGKYSFGSALWRDGRREAAVVSLRPGGLTATVVQNGKPLVIDKADAHPLFQSEEARGWGICAIAGFPLKHSNQVIGAFTITYLKPHTFSEDELLLLNLLADQAAVAVKNASLFDEAERRLHDMSALVDMAKQVTGNLKLNSVLQTTVQILQGLLKARASTITMLSEDGSELVVAAAVGVNPDVIGQARMKIGEGASGEAFRRRELIYIRDTYDEPDFLFFSNVVRSLLVIPLIVRDKAIGTLTVDSDQPDAFNASDMQLLTIAAAQVSVAIANADLFEEVEERAVELAIAYEELKESDRLKDELVQNVSHELRTPLTFVKGYVDLLVEGEMGSLSQDQIESLEIVSTKTDEITRLIEDIITLQRIDSGNLQLDAISIGDFLKTSIVSHQIVANQKGLNVTYKKPATPILAYMDKGRISQVVDNLIGNAMKFSPDGGTISVSVQKQEKDVLVTIADEGIGVPENKQQKIFERFYQVDGSSRRRFGGTGIGLALVKRIIDAHQGQIWVESEVGHGSSFFFTLPRVIQNENAQALSDYAQ